MHSNAELLEILVRGSAPERGEAVYELGNRQAMEAVPNLLPLLEDDAMAPAASRALAQIGIPALEPLRSILKSGKNDLKRWAVITLGDMGAAAWPAIPDLLKVFSTDSLSMREVAADATVQICIEQTDPNNIWCEDLTEEELVNVLKHVPEIPIDLVPQIAAITTWA